MSPTLSSMVRGRPCATLALGSCLILEQGCPSGQIETTEPGSDGDTCGDGVVADPEACDDGDDDPDDGCNSTCERTGVVEWTYTYTVATEGHDAAHGVAVDGTGRVIVVGTETSPRGDSDMLLMALAPDGTWLSKRTFDDPPGADGEFSAVVVDAAGNIYVGGRGVHAFDPDFGELWAYTDLSVQDVVLTADGLYSLGGELLDAGAHQLVVRRHDLATGQTAWKATTQANALWASGQAITAVGANLVAVGYVQDPARARPLIAVFSDAGALVSTQIEDEPDAAWSDVAPIGAGGDLVLVGHRVPDAATGDKDIAVRRVGPDFSERWTRTLDHDLLDDVATSVPVGPDEAIFVAGMAAWMPGEVFGGRFAPDGTLLWTHRHHSLDAQLGARGEAAAFGADFVVIAGYEQVPDEGSNVWVRRLKAD